MLTCVLLESVVVLVSMLINRGDAVAAYNKYFHKTLRNADIVAAFSIKKVFECEVICTEHGSRCKGANLYSHGASHYTCELLATVPDVISDQDLRHEKNSKLIVKLGSGVDVCASTPCQNNGACVNLGHAYRCDCQLPYAGVSCQIDSFQCDNGGTYVDIPARHCSCREGFAGTHCDQVVRVNVATHPETTCTASSNQALSTCSHAINGVHSPGIANEWIPDQADSQDWIMVTFPGLVALDHMTVKSRCNVECQYERLDFTFSDGSGYTGNRACSGSNHWLTCVGYSLVSDFPITATVHTTSVHLSGQESCSTGATVGYGGYGGFIEIGYFGIFVIGDQLHP